MKNISVLPPISTLASVCFQARAQPKSVTIFKAWTRLTTDDHGEMQGEPLQGFYAANTCFLSHHNVKVNGQPISHRLSSQLSANEWSTMGAVLKSGDSGNLPKGKIPKGSIEVRVLRKIEEGWTEVLFIKNNGMQTRKVCVEISFSCPINDQEFAEEMKEGKTNPKKGVIPKVTKTKDGLRLQFKRDFGARKKVPSDELRKMYGDKAPHPGSKVTRALEILVRPKKVAHTTRIQVKPGKTSVIRADAILNGREELRIEIRYSPTVNETRLQAPELDSLEPLPREKSPHLENSLQVDSSNSTLNLVLGQAMVDLHDLQLPIFGATKLDSRDYLAYNAGIPRYIGLFGRDNLVTAWQGPLFGFKFYEPVLKRLELLQGVKKDAWRDEEINRFPHERRLDPRSEIGETNRFLYYGDVASTPFWILALSNLYCWSGERELLVRHQTTVLKCCEWILDRLKDGKGFIYYFPSEGETSKENRNQAWKDSGDAIVDKDGKICVPPLAVAEIQGYAYQALIEAHEILKIVDSDRDYSHFLTEARELKERFNKEFWMSESRFYAVALDGKRQAIKARASNIGHCIDTGIIDEERLADVANGLMADDFFSGWGIRTLSSENPGYDPFSYHRGAVWPVENAFIAHGLANRGFHQEALRIVTAQLNVAAIFQHMRLPEVISGHSRTAQAPTPGLYNFGNLFQAWSVSAIVQNLQTVLGINPRADQNTLYLNPQLPEWLQWIELKNLKVGTHLLHIRFSRGIEGKTHWKLLNSAPGLKIHEGGPLVT